MTLADKTVYQNGSIDTSFDPPLFSFIRQYFYSPIRKKRLKFFTKVSFQYCTFYTYWIYPWTPISLLKSLYPIVHTHSVRSEQAESLGEIIVCHIIVWSKNLNRGRGGGIEQHKIHYDGAWICHNFPCRLEYKMSYFLCRSMFLLYIPVTRLIYYI